LGLKMMGLFFFCGWGLGFSCVWSGFFKKFFFYFYFLLFFFFFFFFLREGNSEWSRHIMKNVNISYYYHNSQNSNPNWRKYWNTQTLTSYRYSKNTIIAVVISFFRLRNIFKPNCISIKIIIFLQMKLKTYFIY
jgi:hypothetical protein